MPMPVARLSPETAALLEAVQVRPSDPDARNALGSHFLAQGHPEAAATCFQAAVAMEPGFAEAHFNLALAVRGRGQPAAAIESLRRAVGLRPNFSQALLVLGNLLWDQGELAEAADCYRSAAAQEPGFAEAHFNLGNAARALGDSRGAEEAYRRALGVRDDFAQAWNNLGQVFKDRNRIDEALACYDRALRADPGLAEAHYNIGVARQLDGRYDESLAHFEQALRCDPSYAPARWLHDLSLPILYERPEDIHLLRRRFAANLERLIRGTPLESAEDRRRALAGVASTTHFFLQYQGQDDRDLQRVYGGFLQRVMAACYPQWFERPPMPALAAGERIRVGYVSSFMRNHTVGQFLLGWLEGHRRERFEIFCYHIGADTDALTERIRARADVFHQVGGHLEAAAGRIAADRLHLLVYTDIGMNALASQLAALRLAPVQCKGWGHPVTTGLPSIDYYLGSDLMEPEDAAGHYSETLVRLPNLALHYTPPALPERPLSRAELGLSEGAFVYLNSQSLFKNLPQHDDVYPRIAREVPHARFVFISHSRPAVTERFRSRLARAFDAYGMPAERFCRFTARLDFAGFLSLNLASDALLDTLEWSGGKTTLEALACGLPVVTCPGRFMRGRHAFAMLRMMGISRTVAADKDEYVRVAVQLARDPGLLAEMRSRVAERRGRLYRDSRFIEALEDFYAREVGRSIALQRGRP
jgi:predicted O-linked N-acetylglucosamine transferase (SPINDLY family)